MFLLVCGHKTKKREKTISSSYNNYGGHMSIFSSNPSAVRMLNCITNKPHKHDTYRHNGIVLKVHENRTLNKQTEEGKKSTEIKGTIHSQ